MQQKVSLHASADGAAALLDLFGSFSSDSVTLCLWALFVSLTSLCTILKRWNVTDFTPGTQDKKNEDKINTWHTGNFAFIYSIYTYFRLKV